MSKMGETFDQKLEENKYEIYDCLLELVDLMDDVCSGDYEPDSFTGQAAKAVIAKVEKL